MNNRRYDVAVIGAGAAGMMAAAVAGQRGLRVLLIDHARRLGEKIRISGGGRCNFTNLGTTPAQFISQNPHFCRSALAAYTPRDFLDLIESYGVRWYEKHRGQLFCDESSTEIIRVLKAECEKGRVHWCMPCSVDHIVHVDGQYVLDTAAGQVNVPQLVLATGGMAIPQLGATDFALRIARQFGLKVVEPRPALVPLTFDSAQWKAFSALSGVSLEVDVKTVGRGATTFQEDLLFTHRGLSGPAILQISSYWNPGEAITIDLAPGQDLEQQLLQAKQGGRQLLATALAGLWPRRLAEQWLSNTVVASPGQRANTRALGEQRLADIPDRVLRALAQSIHAWTLHPSGTAGYRKAEVMRGGVDTNGINQRTMEARKVPGLYIVGEALDVTGWLGGYNFQWGWASGVACGRALQRVS